MYYSFEQMCNFKPGEQYWENSQYGEIKFTVKEDPKIVVGELSGEEKVEFIGVTDKGEEIYFLMCKNYPYYGPRISDSQQYFSSNQLKNWIRQ